MMRRRKEVSRFQGPWLTWPTRPGNTRDSETETRIGTTSRIQIVLDVFPFDQLGGSCHEDDNSLLMTVSPPDDEEEDDEAPGEDDARRLLGEPRRGRSGELVWEIGSCLMTLEDVVSGRGRNRAEW